MQILETSFFPRKSKSPLLFPRCTVFFFFLNPEVSRHFSLFLFMVHYKPVHKFLGAQFVFNIRNGLACN